MLIGPQEALASRSQIWAVHQTLLLARVWLRETKEAQYKVTCEVNFHLQLALVLWVLGLYL